MGQVLCVVGSDHQVIAECCACVCCIRTAVASLWENGCWVLPRVVRSIVSFIFMSLGSGLRRLWCVACCHGFIVVGCWRIVFEYSVVMLGKKARES